MASVVLCGFLVGLVLFCTAGAWVLSQIHQNLETSFNPVRREQNDCDVSHQARPVAADASGVSAAKPNGVPRGRGCVVRQGVWVQRRPLLWNSQLTTRLSCPRSRPVPSTRRRERRGIGCWAGR